jgi:hypothetical protein
VASFKLGPIKRGDDRSLTITATYPADHANAGDPYDLTGDKVVWFTAKRHLSDADEDAVILKETGEGISVLSPTNTARVQIDAADTVGLPDQEIVLQFDVQVKDGTEVITIADGTLSVLPDVTRRIS